MHGSGRTMIQYKKQISSLLWYIPTNKNLQSELNALMAACVAIKQAHMRFQLETDMQQLSHPVFWIPGVFRCETDEPTKTAAYLAMSCGREPGRSELHLSKWNGSVFTFPVYPDYSLYGKGNRKMITSDLSIAVEEVFVSSMKCGPYLIVTVDAIKTIEIGLVAVLVPPASHIGPGTVNPQSIRVLVPG